jgi:hypothetical protein
MEGAMPNKAPTLPDDCEGADRAVLVVPDRGLAPNMSKTIRAPMDALFGAFTDDAIRRRSSSRPSTCRWLDP